MLSKRRRIIDPINVLVHESGNLASLKIPAGDIVTIMDGAALHGYNLVNVLWDGKQVMMFAQDLRSRSELAD